MRPFTLGIINASGTLTPVLLGLADVAFARGWIIRTEPLSLEVLAGTEPPPSIDVCVVCPQGDDSVSRLRKYGIPTICVAQDFSAQNVTSIIPDDDAVGHLAGQHLLERGLRRFAALSLADTPFAQARVAAFAESVQNAGADFLYPGMAFQTTDKPLKSGDRVLTAASIRQWISGFPKPIGVFVPCDVWAPLVLNYAFDVNCSIPGELAVVSVDNDEVRCQTTSPPLSSVIIPWRRIGNEIGELIARTVAVGLPLSPERIIVPPAGVAVRKSSDMVAVADPNVAAALVFINRNALKPIDVADILRAVPVTRKRLEAGFRHYVGHGIMHEIRRLRVQEAQRLLALTLLSMADIAARTGFPTQNKLATIFRRYAAMTPSEYRNRFRI